MRILSFAACLLFLASFASAADGPPLPGTKQLTLEGDIASQLVDGVDKFLLGELEKSVERRAQHWKRDFSSPEAYSESLTPNRKRLAHILGLRDAAVPFESLEFVSTVRKGALAGRGDKVTIYVVRWPAFADVWGEGLLLVPANGDIHASVVAIPDADQTPEQLAGLSEGIAPESQFARRLAENGCYVLVPALIDRKMEKRGGRSNLSSREYLYRSAFELGRHLVGYELAKVRSGIDWFTKDPAGKGKKIGVFGYGEGGMLALYAAALDERIDAAVVSGHFDSRQNIWQEPIDRNVFRLLDEFGDAELAAMVSPRALVIEASKGPEVTLPGDGGGAPAKLTTAKLAAVQSEVARARSLVAALKPAAKIELVESGDGDGPFGTATAITALCQALGVEAKPVEGSSKLESRAVPDNAARQKRQMHELDRHSQLVLAESADVRKQFMSKLDTSSVAKYETSVEPYREMFRNEVIGRFDEQLLPANVRTRNSHDTEKWTGYEVVLDVFPDVIAYGLLLLPKDLKDGEKRPVVVCQHGLEGRPQDTIGEQGSQYYSAFAGKLAERGFITFAPQNLYIFKDRFRTLQRKANPLGKTLFSIIVPQHQQIVDWLSTLPFVDKDRIAFYGLSYGGKSAMRIPPLVKNYCLSICSADFNEWVKKNASTRAPYSYVWTGEYEIFEFDLGSTFNYAEMAALIAPRPFMVERGHFDGVGVDEEVGFEYAKVQHLYAARLKIPDRCEIEWFDGPHKINGKGTYDFLHKHLNWPAR
jgi:dienelactone hydrolase